MSAVSIVLEGINFSGKTTQALNLQRGLEKENKEVFYAKSPQGSLMGEQIFSNLLEMKNPSVGLEMFSFLSMNSFFFNDVLIKKLSEDNIIVFDRWLGSFLNYFHYIHNLPLESLHSFCDYVCGGFKPDIIILIDISSDEAISRMIGEKKLSRFDSLDIKEVEKQRLGFHDLARRFNWTIVDGNRVVNDVYTNIRDIIAPLLT